jgi:hypothetical protein
MLDLEQKAVSSLKDFSASGISILADDGQLKIESVKPLTDDQRNLIRKLKSDLLEYFNDQALIEKHFSKVEEEAEQDAFQNARNLLFPEPSVSETERETLKEIYRLTISTGSYLHHCTDPEQAERFNNFLMHHLPLNFASGVIRDCEINTFNFQH